MRKKISLISGLIICLLVFFFGAAQGAFAVEIAGNTLDNAKGLEFQLLSGQAGAFLELPAYFLELVQGKGVKLSPTNSVGTRNAAPYNFALFGLRGVGNLLDGWLRFNDTAGGERFQWSKDGTIWSDFGGSITGGDCPAGQFATGVNANGTPRCATETQDVLFGQGLRRDAMTNSFGLVQCIADGQVLKWNSAVSQWDCAAPASASQWTTIAGGIKYTGGNVGIGAGITDAEVISPLTVKGDVAAGGFTTAGTVDAGSVIARGGNITAQSSFSTNWRYEPGAFVAGHSAPRCAAASTDGKMSCDTSSSAPDCGGLIYDIGTNPGASPVTCYDWYTSAAGSNEQRAYNRRASATVGGWVNGTTGYSDTISIGGDSTDDDLEVRVNAPSNRNLVSFTNTSAGGLAKIKAGGLIIPTGAVAGYALVSDASGNASWQAVAPPSTSTGTSLWGGPTLTGNIYYTSGNVGIGTKNPAGPLHVRASVVPTGSGASLACPIGFSYTLADDVNGDGVLTENIKECFKDSFVVSGEAGKEGNVGIGTNAPTAKFEVKDELLVKSGGPVEVIKNLLVNAGEILEAEKTELSSLFKLVVKGDLLTLTNNGASLIGGKLSIGPATGPTAVGFGADLLVKGITQEPEGTGSLVVSTNPFSVTAIISNGGQFVVGDTIRVVDVNDPTRYLIGEITIKNGNSVGGMTNVAGTISLTTNQTLSVNVFKDVNLTEIQNGAGTAKFVINKSGNVGIGTIPEVGVQLDVRGKGRTVQIINGPYALDVAGGLTVLRAGLEVGGGSYFKDSVGIGKAASAYALDIVGNVNIDNRGLTGYGLDVAGGLTVLRAGLEVGGGSYFKDSVGIGTPSPGAMLDVAGSIKVDGSSYFKGPVGIGVVPFNQALRINGGIRLEVPSGGVSDIVFHNSAGERIGGMRSHEGTNDLEIGGGTDWDKGVGGLSIIGDVSINGIEVRKIPINDGEDTYTSAPHKADTCDDDTDARYRCPASASRSCHDRYVAGPGGSDVGVDVTCKRTWTLSFITVTE